MNQGILPMRRWGFGINSVTAKQGVREALALAPGHDIKILGGLALARIGDDSPAETLAGELAKSDPSSTVLMD